MTVPRPEYPRPQFRRQRWHNLNGAWAFAFDDADEGLARSWSSVTAEDLHAGNGPLGLTIVVPFVYQSARSGIADSALHEVIWYARTFDDIREDATERLLLHLGAVHYRATVWVNGRQVAQHEGGQTPFGADITHAVEPAGNVIVVRAEDPHTDLTIPRGKRYWHEEPEGIFYTPCSGIWQTVWLEPVAALHIADTLRLSGDIDAAELTIAASVEGPHAGASLAVQVRLGDLVLVDDRHGLTAADLERRYSLLSPRAGLGPHVADTSGLALWSPEAPHLHDVRLELSDAEGRVVDTVDSYLGLRKVEARDGRVHLNHRPYYQRLVLDQGYFPGGLVTASEDDEYRRDIELAKELGFNGARKHQKSEDPRWLYWADRLGFLVWAEAASPYRYSEAMAGRVVSQWGEAVLRDRNHPCIVTWVPLNESWGLPNLRTDPRHRNLVLALTALTRALDPTRLVVSNDGWEQAGGDLCAIHDYADAATLRARYATAARALASEPAGKPLYAPGFAYQGQPVLVTEFGGLALGTDPATWGYHAEADAGEFAERYAEFVAALVASETVQGFCYTQLTDVEQEANGLLTVDRKPKADPALLRQATQQAPAPPGLQARHETGQ